MRERLGNPDSNEDGHFRMAPRDQDTVETVQKGHCIRSSFFLLLF